MIVNRNDPNLDIYDTDINGDNMYEYNGVPFTGIIRYYFTNAPYTNVVEGELSYVNGEIEGLQTTYFENGQMASQFIIGLGGYDGMMQEWDKQGNLIYSKMWIKGFEQ
jgi:antitoxin component YwqK of YwqJK toxin-antitoxin module